MWCSERLGGKRCKFEPRRDGKCGYHSESDATDRLDASEWNATLSLPEPERAEAQARLLRNAREGDLYT